MRVCSGRSCVGGLAVLAIVIIVSALGMYLAGTYLHP